MCLKASSGRTAFRPSQSCGGNSGSGTGVVIGQVRLASLFVSLWLGGCGLYVPRIEEAWEGGKDAVFFESNIKGHVYCELQRAIALTSMKGDSPEDQVTVTDFNTGVKRDALPDDWGVQITLSFQVDETGAVNPSASLLTSPTFSVGLGASLSSQATRVDKYDSYYAVAPLKLSIATGGNEDCSIERNSSLLSGDLGILTWLKQALAFEQHNRSSKVTSSAFKQDVLSYETKFIVITSGNANPQWKLVRVATNQSGSPLLSASRTRSHDLLITFGPTGDGTPGKKKGSTPGAMAANSHLAEDIGRAVANALAARVTIPP